MKITNETNLEQQSIMFLDGENGYFLQRYSLLADGEDTGVTLQNEGHTGQKDTTRFFFFKDKQFKNVKDAFKAAGHEWLK